MFVWFVFELNYSKPRGSVTRKLSKTPFRLCTFNMHVGLGCMSCGDLPFARRRVLMFGTTVRPVFIVFLLADSGSCKRLAAKKETRTVHWTREGEFWGSTEHERDLARTHAARYTVNYKGLHMYVQKRRFRWYLSVQLSLKADKRARFHGYMTGSGTFFAFLSCSVHIFDP